MCVCTALVCIHGSLRKMHTLYHTLTRCTTTNLARDAHNTRIVHRTYAVCRCVAVQDHAGWFLQLQNSTAKQCAVQAFRAAVLSLIFVENVEVRQNAPGNMQN